MYPTRIRVRIQENDTHVLHDVVASVKVQGHILLVYRLPDGFYQFAHGPTGLRDVMKFHAMASILDRIDEIRDILDGAVCSQEYSMFEKHMPDINPSTGLESYRWQDREEMRFILGDYVPVPAIPYRTYPVEHYLHLSLSQPDMVAYTPSEEKGQQDRQVVIKFGKYLKKTFPGMTDAEIQSAVALMQLKVQMENAAPELRFATDRSTINDIFETKMCACDSRYTSCMYDKFDGDSVRPYHVYADSPDVAVAYVVEKGAIVSRSVVSTKDMEWVRCYSISSDDNVRCKTLETMLSDAGYEKGDLIGNRLTVLDDDDVMLPYIDRGGMGVYRNGKYWIVCDKADSDAEYTADCTDGTATPKYRCDGCGNHEDNCECSWCECCENRYPDGCPNCNMCEQCDRCREHGNCRCHRCSDCDNIVDPASRYTPACRCTRCDDCGELEDNCECSEEDVANEETCVSQNC